jgi:hypothetical protein
MSPTGVTLSALSIAERFAITSAALGFCEQ